MPSRQPQQSHTSTNLSTQTQAPITTRPFAPQTEQSVDSQQAQDNSSPTLKRTSQVSHSLSTIAIGSSAAIHPQPIQAKLEIGDPDDKYEEEADRVADQVVNRIQASSNHPLQRADAPDEEELQMKPLVDSIQRVDLPDEELQMKAVIQRQSASMAAPSDVEKGIEQARGKGQALDKSIRQPMEQAFGADFSSVRVHTGGKADQLNQSIQARAFTTGQDVFFRQGEYQPNSRGGQELLAHELTHVVQQNSGSIKRMPQIQTLVPAPAAVAIALSRVGETVQREISKEQFIQDTTSSFMCISWRKGDESERQEMEELLDTFENTKGVLERVKALDALTGKARSLNSGSRSSKFKSACEKVVNEGQELRFTITDSQEYKEALEKDEQKKKEQAEEQERLRLEGLADLNEEGRIEAFSQEYGGALLDTLLAGTTDLSPDAKALKLTHNFKNIGFEYTMKNSNFKALLSGTTKGDCNTLSTAMAKICNEIFLIDASIESHADLLVTSNEKTIDGAKEPNGEGGEFWIFDNHYWVKANGVEYDPLFGRAFSNQGWHPLKSEKEFKDLGITVEDYGGEYRMVLLHGAGNKRIGNVTPQEWEAHKQGVSIEINDSFDEMKQKVLQ